MSLVSPDDRKESATAFLTRALAWFGRHGVVVERVMSDNGSAYRSREFAAAIAAAGLKHIRTRGIVTGTTSAKRKACGTSPMQPLPHATASSHQI